MRIGIDLGGTKIEAILLHPQGEILLRERLATPQGDYAATLQAIAALVKRMESHPAVRQPGLPVGIGIPGALSLQSGRVKNANSVCLIGEDLAADLQQLLARPIRLANDADCFTLSEATDGAAAGAPIVFGVILGTGVGGGIAVQGALLQGVNSICGEWGHNPLPWPTNEELPGHPCYCGRLGCIETFLSGPGLMRHHRQSCGQELQSHAIVQAAEAGDPCAETSLQLYEQRLARALASVINLLDPYAIVLGGGLANVQRWYKTVPTLWQPYIFSDSVETRLLPAKHGDSSGVRGAAWLWPSPGQGSNGRTP
ncbi:ROK family protein [Candidatus Magnetaquicoccus inordinatus]|uniref:ROK family protein n=1 Tax=Candidatus Magnetaquicoccus inordinatus TaxID=2496818 RepID=UPI00102C9AE3|nr:ROK family protein [Candidatus Magnetaquicoccus inordinatus]